jgi:hypothetical protein
LWCVEDPARRAESLIEASTEGRAIVSPRAEKGSMKGIIGSFPGAALLLACTTLPAAPEPYTMTLSTLFGGSGYERAQWCAVDAKGFGGIPHASGAGCIPISGCPDCCVQ